MNLTIFDAKIFTIQAQAIKSNKESGEHKQRITMYTTLKGIRIVDEKTQVSVVLVLILLPKSIQGPKLTVLCRRQVATEIFFSVTKWKNLVAKKWFVIFLLHSETRKH